MSEHNPTGPGRRGGRRTQAERSETMRARLAAAAYAAIAEGGLKGLRLKAVAEAAGVSQGALLHHFPDKRTVTLAAIRTALELARDDAEARLAESPNGAEPVLRAMLDEFRAFFESERFWVAIGITIEASKDPDLYPALRADVAALRKPVYAAWASRLVANGWDEAAATRTVRSAAAMISGMAIRRFWADPDAVTSEVIEEWIARRLV